MNESVDKKLFKDLENIAKQLIALTNEGVTFIEPRVNYIIKQRVKDDWQIQHVLDRLLDLAGMSEKGLSLFKELCRYYYYINQEAAIDYVRFYHEMYIWEDDAEDCEPEPLAKVTSNG